MSACRRRPKASIGVVILIIVGALGTLPPGNETGYEAGRAFVACASPEYLDRAGVPRVPADLLRHTL
jgi:hypothetical protein